MMMRAALLLSKVGFDRLLLFSSLSLFFFKDGAGVLGQSQRGGWARPTLGTCVAQKTTAGPLDPQWLWLRAACGGPGSDVLLTEPGKHQPSSGPSWAVAGK